MTSTIVYMAVCYDRHVDDEISIHITQEGAINKCQEFMDNYGIILYGKSFIPDWFKLEDGYIHRLEFDFDEAPYTYAKRVKLEQ